MNTFYTAIFSLLFVGFNASAQIGSLDHDLTFVPVSPCRILDTRVGGGIISATATRDFIVRTASTGNFTSQGGSSTNCEMNAGVNTAAIAVNLTVVSPAASGYITAYPAGTTKPLAATVNFNTGDVRGNFAIVQVNQSAATQLSIFTSSATHVVGDIVGYYSRPKASILDCITSSPQILAIPANGYSSITLTACPASFTSTATNCLAGNSGMQLLAVDPYKCTAVNTNQFTTNLTATQRCCRVPGR